MDMMMFCLGLRGSRVSMRRYRWRRWISGMVFWMFEDTMERRFRRSILAACWWFFQSTVNRRWLFTWKGFADWLGEELGRYSWWAVD